MINEWLNSKIDDIKLCYRILFKDEVLLIIHHPLNYIQEAEEALQYALSPDAGNMTDRELVEDSLDNIVMARRYLIELTKYQGDRDY